jgi:hypothetical protein
MHQWHNFHTKFQVRPSSHFLDTACVQTHKNGDDVIAGDDVFRANDGKVKNHNTQQWFKTSQ